VSRMLTVSTEAVDDGIGSGVVPTQACLAFSHA